MVSEVTINIFPILVIILVFIAIVGFFTIIHKLLELNTLKKQVRENNVEIHELNVKLENYEDNIHNLKGKVDKILQKLDEKIDELEK